MGQRLVVSLTDEDQNTIAVVYYHWSAYFASTIEECANLGKAIVESEKDGKDVLTSILDMLEKNGGGIGVNDRNLEEAAKRFPGREFRSDISRNNGLIYLGNEEIQETLDMAEGTAEINIPSKMVYNGVLHSDFFDFQFYDGGCKVNGQSIDVDPEEMTIDECIRLDDFIRRIYLDDFITRNNRTKKGE